MRCIIARFPFDLVKTDVQASMKGIKPEPITGESVLIGRRHYPVKQVGEIITAQDRRDFSTGEMIRALTRLGFTCRTTPAPTSTTDRTPATILTPLQTASAMLGTPTHA